MTSSDERTKKTTCPRCGFKTAAIVLASGERQGELISEPTLQSYFCRCTSCDREFLLDSYFSLSRLGSLNPSEVLSLGTNLGERFSWQACYPMQHVVAPENIPPSVLQFYLEASKALANSLPNASGAMFRKTLEAATLDASIVSQVASGTEHSYRTKMLFARIRDLKAGGLIPPAMYDLVDTIRIEGNTAAHDVEGYTIEQAKALEFFVNAMLTQLFSLPAKLKASRALSSAPPVQT